MNPTDRFRRMSGGRVKLVGVLGGIASGKSTVTKVLAEFGARVFDADRVVHVVLARPDIVRAVRERWGDEILAADGSVDRAALARRVFSDEEERRALEAIVHGPVFDALERTIAEVERALAPGVPSGLLVVDAALMAETGLIEACRWRIYVEAPFEVRRQRTVSERGWDAQELARREAHQMSLEAKKALADVVVDGTQGLAPLREEIAIFLEREVGVVPYRPDPESR